MKEVKKGKYLHYKGKKYEVIGTARDSETLEGMIVYKALYLDRKFGRNALWVRPVKEFLEKVIVGGKMVPRFRYLEK